MEKLSLKKLVLWISYCFLNILITIRGNVAYFFISICISMLVSGVIILRNKKLEEYLIKKDYKIKKISVIFTLISINEFVMHFIYKYTNNEKIEILLSKFFINPDLIVNIIGFFLGILASYSLFQFWKILLNYIYRECKKFLNDLKKYELILLSSFFIFLSIIIIFSFLKTNIFYLPRYNNELKNFDVIFTSDTGMQYITNVFMNISAPENDIRQPLFGLYTLPLAILSKILSKVFYFIPESYALFLQINQLIMVLISGILLARMMKFKEKEKFILYYIAYIFSYSVLIWIFPLEQYIISLFYLILFLYSILVENKKSILLYIGATGTLLTSGIFLPFLLEKQDLNIKNILAKSLNIFFWFNIISILSGQFYVIITAFNQIITLRRFMGEKLLFLDKVKQFFNFITSCFIAPKTIFKISEYEASLQLEQTKELNFLGVIIILIIFLGVIKNYQNKFYLICISWIIFSFILLGVLGWGSIENGMVLYGMYFSWAYISSIFKSLDSIIKNKKLFLSLLVIGILIMIQINFLAIVELIKFGIKYYRN